MKTWIWVSIIVVITVIIIFFIIKNKKEKSAENAYVNPNKAYADKMKQDLVNGVNVTPATEAIGTAPSMEAETERIKASSILAQQAAFAAQQAAAAKKGICRSQCVAIHPFNKSKRESCQASC